MVTGPPAPAPPRRPRAAPAASSCSSSSTRSALTFPCCLDVSVLGRTALEYGRVWTLSCAGNFPPQAWGTMSSAATPFARKGPNTSRVWKLSRKMRVWSSILLSIVAKLPPGRPSSARDRHSASVLRLHMNMKPAWRLRAILSSRPSSARRAAPSRRASARSSGSGRRRRPGLQRCRELLALLAAACAPCGPVAAAAGGRRQLGNGGQQQLARTNTRSATVVKRVRGCENSERVTRT